MRWPARLYPIRWLFLLTVLGWGMGAGAEESQAEPSRPVAEARFAEVIGGLVELMSAEWVNQGEGIAPMLFRGRVVATGVTSASVMLWGGRRLRMLIIPLFNPEGAEPLELGDGVLKDEEGTELGRVPARLAGNRLEPGKKGLLLVGWGLPLPGKPVRLEIHERQGARVIQVLGGLR